jgi:pyruvate,water dikinase
MRTSDPPGTGTTALPSDAPTVVRLEQVDRTSIALAGGKGANLGELIRAGFPVPDGCVITTAAYAGLFDGPSGRALRDLVQSLDPTDLQRVPGATAAIREALSTVPIGESLRVEILAAASRLDGAIAVRSSATAEDLPGRTSAGQQETFLNVQGQEELIAAVRACWASLWSERAVLYREHTGVDHFSARMAVVLQRMLAPDLAGVMFTADPATGSRRRLTVDASPGLGEAVVSGLVTPDHYIVRRPALRIERVSRGRAETVIKARAGGGVERVLAGAGAPDELPPRALRRLAIAGIHIERLFGRPQDVEWAWTAGPGLGTLHILQARAMTALPEPNGSHGSPSPIVPLLAEMWPTRPYPLDMSTFAGAVEGAVGELLASLLGPKAPRPEDTLVEEDGVVVRFRPPRFRPSAATLAAPVKALWRTRRFRNRTWDQDPILTEVTEQARALGTWDPRKGSWAGNLSTLNRALALAARALDLRLRYVPWGLLRLGLLALLVAAAGKARLVGDLLGGVDSKTTQTNRALESLAQGIRADSRLVEVFRTASPEEMPEVLRRDEAGRAFLGSLSELLDTYGHREVSLGLAHGTWRDRPEIVLGILKALAAGTAPRASSRPAWQAARAEVEGSPLIRVPGLRGMFGRALGRARELVRLREDSHFYATLPLPAVRSVVLELGRRLTTAGVIPRPEDVLHFRREELEATAGDDPRPDERSRLHALWVRRSARREALAAVPLFDPRLLVPRKDGHARGRASGALLHGTPASPGVAAGTARIIRDMSDFGRLAPGDVLVAPVTNPSWTPLFQRAAAVVVDAGGAASHAAIVAREYGLPAVMGTGEGTRKLADGDWIRVDGTRGLVFRYTVPR